MITCRLWLGTGHRDLMVWFRVMNIELKDLFVYSSCA
jgi:hypothetical protein